MSTCPACVLRRIHEIPYLFELRHPLELTHPLFFDLANILNPGNDAQN